MAVGQNKHYTSAVKKQSYDDAFEDVMSYVDTHVGKRKIKDQDDLRQIFEELNAKEEKKGKTSRMSDKFITVMVEKAGQKGYFSKTARSRGGNVVGSEKVTKREEKARSYRRENKEVYYYQTHRTPFNDEGEYHRGYENNRIAVKSTYKTKGGKSVVVFRDVETGRFISKEQKNTLRDSDY